jgi:hypothetical protein
MCAPFHNDASADHFYNDAASYNDSATNNDDDVAANHDNYHYDSPADHDHGTSSRRAFLRRFLRSSKF